MVIWLIKKIANKVTIKSSQNTPATVEHEWKIPKKKKMDVSRAKTANYWWMKIKMPTNNQHVRQHTKSTT